MAEIWPLINFSMLIVAIVAMLAVSIILRRQLDIIHDRVNSNLSVAQQKLNDAIKTIERLENKLEQRADTGMTREAGLD